MNPNFTGNKDYLYYDDVRFCPGSENCKYNQGQGIPCTGVRLPISISRDSAFAVPCGLARACTVANGRRWCFEAAWEASSEHYRTTCRLLTISHHAHYMFTHACAIHILCIPQWCWVTDFSSNTACDSAQRRLLEHIYLQILTHADDSRGSKAFIRVCLFVRSVTQNE